MNTTHALTGTSELLRRIADLLEEEAIQTRYLSILGSWGPDGLPLVSIDESAFRAMFAGCEIDVSYESQIVRMNASRSGVMWQATSFERLSGPIHTKVKL